MKKITAKIILSVALIFAVGIAVLPFTVQAAGYTVTATATGTSVTVNVTGIIQQDHTQININSSAYSTTPVATFTVDHSTMTTSTTHTFTITSNGTYTASANSYVTTANETGSQSATSGSFTISGNSANPPANTNTDYYPLAPLPGLTVACGQDPDSNDPNNTNCIHTQIDPATNPCPFGNYLNAMIKIFIGICAVLAMIMIVLGGIEYIMSELISSKEEGKKRITGALFGLIIALGAYALLNTINPAVLQICLNQLPNAIVTVTADSDKQYVQEQTQTTTTQFARTSFYNQIITTSALPQYNIPPCLLEVAIQRESGGVTGLVGHDENAPSAGIRSRRDFIASGLKADGTTFTPNDQTKITDHTFLNNGNWAGNNIYTAPNPSATDLGMDWRFSASIGMFGVTFFPHGSTLGANYDVGLPVTTISGHTTVLPHDILSNPQLDIQVAAEVMHNMYNSCNQDVQATWRKYSSGSCTGNNAFTNIEAPLRTNLYNQCVAQL